MLNTPFNMLNTPFNMLNIPFNMLNTPFNMLNTPFNMLNQIFIIVIIINIPYLEYTLIYHCKYTSKHKNKTQIYYFNIKWQQHQSPLIFNY
jgi:hypothetical protein